MTFDILTIFPHILDSYIGESILKRAQEKNAVAIHFWDIRDYTNDKHRSVDDAPYGGGPGMIFKVEPVYRCLEKVIGREKLELRITNYELRITNHESRIILMSPQGAQLTQQRTEALSRHDRLVLICGRYEGVDARILQIVDEEISIGPYVLSGGELPAMVLTEAVARLVPGVLGSADSLMVESYGSPQIKNDPQGVTRHAIEYPQYTRPEVFEPMPGISWRVPEVLLSGDHKKIEEWRRKEMNFPCSTRVPHKSEIAL